MPLAIIFNNNIFMRRNIRHTCDMITDSTTSRVSFTYCILTKLSDLAKFIFHLDTNELQSGKFAKRTKTQFEQK